MEGFTIELILKKLSKIIFILIIVVSIIIVQLFIYKIIKYIKKLNNNVKKNALYVKKK